MTTLELIDRVLNKLGEPSNIAGPEIEAILPSALYAFGSHVANDARPHMRELLRKDFSVAVASGTGDLSAHLTASEPLIIENVPQDYFAVTGGTVPMQGLPDRVQLGLARSTAVIWYTIDGSTLRTRNTDGSLSTLTTTVTVTANYVPTIGNVPSQLADEFVELVCSMLVPH
jgi:hypothetical protein